LQLARRAIEARQLEVAQDLLDSARATPAGEDLREFSWRYLWNAARPEIVTLSPRNTEPDILVLTPDGKTLVSRHLDRTVTLWDLSSERPRATLGPYEEDLVISPAGRYSFGWRYSSDGTRPEEFVACELTTGRTLRKPVDAIVPGPSESIVSLFIGVDRALAWSWYRPNTWPGCTVQTWDLRLDPAMQKPLATLGRLYKAFFSSPSDLIVTLEEGGIFAREAGSAAIRCKLSERSDASFVGHLSEDGRWLAVCFPEGLVVVLDTSNGAERERHKFPTPIPACD
jgi:hypothetical protein